MQPKVEAFRSAFTTAYRRFFSGRIARTTFVIRVAILLGVLFLLGAVTATILATSSPIVKDLFQALSLAMLALCLLGFISAYVKRLHDIGLRGYWAIALLIVAPAVLLWAFTTYTNYRWQQDHSFSTDSANGLLGWIILGIPLLVALWRSQPGENQFGPLPQPVEHITASRFNIAVIFGAAAILIPFCIHAGLFQHGVWVGRGVSAPNMPLVDSSRDGQTIMRCWNIKGVGAGSGHDDMGGVYRDSFKGGFDFVQKPDGQIDIVPVGQSHASSYLADGFKIVPYGLPQGTLSYEILDKLDRFMLVAYYDQGRPDETINFTTFSVGRVEDTFPNFQVVMSTALSQPKSPIKFVQFPLARGRLMVGDCTEML
jgi:uncharacterized membrane protein YhaH (DUF805 family)